MQNLIRNLRIGVRIILTSRRKNGVYNSKLMALIKTLIFIATLDLVIITIIK